MQFCEFLEMIARLANLFYDKQVKLNLLSFVEKKWNLDEKIEWFL